MRYLVTLRAPLPTSPPPAGLIEAIMAVGAEATAAGALLDTAGLHPSAAGARLTVSAGDIAVTDGPFAEAKEMISYALYEVQSKEEAIEWTSRFLAVHRDLWPGWEGEADVLKVFGPEDFGR